MSMKASKIRNILPPKDVQLENVYVHFVYFSVVI